MNLRKLARGKPCMVRLPGCTGGGDDTVLAHFRMAAYVGAGMKPTDLCGAWACFHCHNIVDGRTRTDLEWDFLRYAHSMGVIRTMSELVKIGAIKW